jgi:hypothetical protein
VVACITDTGLGGPLIRELLLDRIEQGALHDRRLLAGQDVAFVLDFTDIEPTAQQIEQRGLVARGARPRRAAILRITAPRTAASRRRDEAMVLVL